MHVTMLLKEAGSSARVAESPFSLSDGRCRGREKKADNNTSASIFDADIAPIARPANKLQHHMRDLDVFFYHERWQCRVSCGGHLVGERGRK